VTAQGLTRRFVVLRGLRWMPIGILLPFIILLPLARGLSLAEAGAIWALHSLVALLFEVPSGAVADGYGRRRTLVAGASLMAVSLVIYAVAEVPLAFAAGTGTLAAARALISGSLEAWYVDTLRAIDPGAALSPGLSRGSIADGLGMAAGALAGGFLPLAFGGLDHSGAGFIFYTPVTLIAAGVAVGYLVAVLVLVEETPPPPASASVRAKVLEILAATRTQVRGSLVVRTVLVVAVAFGVAVSAVELLWQPRLADLLGDAEEHSVLFGVLVAGSMAALAAGAALSPRVIAAVGSRNGYCLVVALGAVLLMALAAAASPAALVLAYLLFFASLGLADPVHFELLHEATGDAVRATVLSAESLAGQGGGIVGNLALGAVAGASGVPAAWLIAGGLVGLSALLVLRLPRTHGAVPAAPAS
jgi:MFS family permease